VSNLKDLGDLTDRRALVTGATGNLGRVFCETLAELGADLILVDVPGSDFGSLEASLIEKWKVEVEIFPCDLEVQEQRGNLLAGIRQSKRGLNILINNAAFVGSSSLVGWNVPFDEQNISSWSRALEVNLTAIFEITQGLIPIMKQSLGANIINVASIYGIYAPDWRLYQETGMSNPAAYAVSKGGLIQFTRWLSTTVSPSIRVNAIAPGGILRGQPVNFVDRYNSKVPLGRMATEEDFKGVLAFLSSDLSSYVTGQILQVDGGWGTW
jgi:NAD(P)-dependent dehydrogenase (short-subunit alcohol dehydrogenase family)